MNYQRRSSYCDISLTGNCATTNEGNCPSGYISNSSSLTSCYKLPNCVLGLKWDLIAQSWVCVTNFTQISTNPSTVPISCPSYSARYTNSYFFIVCRNFQNQCECIDGAFAVWGLNRYVTLKLNGDLKSYNSDNGRVLIFIFIHY